MAAAIRVARALTARRKVQTMAIGVVVAMSALAVVTALGLALASSDPITRAFDEHRAAHLAMTFDAGLVTPEELAATTSAPSVAAAAGPYGEAEIVVPELAQVGLGHLTVVGRDRPDGSVDQLTLWAGRWADRAGEIVLASPVGNAGYVPVGSRLTLANGSPLTVVGYAYSVGHTADGWVSIQQVSAWAPDAFQMLYRFHHAATATELQAAQAQVTAGLDPAALLGRISYLALKQQAMEDANLFVPFLAVFGLLAAIVAVLIVANMVGGIVISGLRRVGILKSLGFTPNQIIGIHLGIVELPAVVGGLVGVAIGYIAGNTLASSALEGFGIESATVPWWVPLAVFVAALVVVGLAALGPSLRARQLPAATAISDGSMPRAGHGLRAQRGLARLPLPRSLTLGAGLSCARIGRSMLTAASVVIGVAVVTLTVGTTASVILFEALANPHVDGRVLVSEADPAETGPGSSLGAPLLTDPSLESQLAGLPGVQDVGAALHAEVTVLGSSGSALVRFYRADPAMLPAVSAGHQPSAVGEATAAVKFMTRHGLQIGDTITIGYDGSQIPVRIVGVVIGQAAGELSLTWSTLLQLDPAAEPSEYQVQLHRDDQRAVFAAALAAAHPELFVQSPRENDPEQATAIVTGVVILTVILAFVSALGVFNTVLLTVHERRREVGTLKSIGMTPRQVVTMYITSTGILGLVGGAVGVLVGFTAHRILMPLVVWRNAGIPLDRLLAVLDWPILLALALSGIVIAVVGSALPAHRAAKTPIATVLHNE